MAKKSSIIRGTLILTMTGFLSRFMGFFYRIFMSHSFGEEGVGLYQLIFLSMHFVILSQRPALKLPFHGQ